MGHLWRVVKARRYVRIRVRGLDRVSVPLSGCTTDEGAEVRAALIARAAEQLVAVGAGARLKALGTAIGKAATGEELEAARVAVARAVEEARRATPASVVTVEQFAERWLSGELARTFPDHVKAIDHGDNRARLEMYVFPLIGGGPIAELSLEDGDRVMVTLPSQLSPAMRRHVAQCVYRLAHLAVYPAKVLAACPFPKGWLPRIGKPREAPYLYPAEDAKLLGCRDIPLRRRLAYGLLAREGFRPGELVGRRKGREARSPMRWTTVDLAYGSVRLDQNKTERPRTWALDPGTTRALVAWHRGPPSADVYVIGWLPKLADWLRADLKLAGVARPELAERNQWRRPLRAHDLRGTFITLSLANGKTESWVQDRTGHTSTLMIQRYRRAARTAAELELGPLLPLDEAIPELRG